jgi:hypothetical protein
VSDRASVVLGALAGAIVGGCVGYLWFTPEGRRLREDLEPQLAGLATEIERARAMLQDARGDADPSPR